MGLAGALVDRARVVSREPTNVKVEGTSEAVSVSGEWFKARMTLGSSQEKQAGISSVRAGAQDASTQRRRVVKRPTLLFAVRDLTGQPVILTAEDRVEIDSKELGRDVYLVDGDPEPLRAKRKVLGWQVTLRRVADEVAEDKLTIAKPAGSPRLL